MRKLFIFLFALLLVFALFSNAGAWPFPFTYFTGWDIPGSEFNKLSPQNCPPPKTPWNLNSGNSGRCYRGQALGGFSGLEFAGNALPLFDSANAYLPPAILSSLNNTNSSGATTVASREEIVDLGETTTITETGKAAPADETTAPVPEPSTLLLIGTGLLGLLGYTSRKRVRKNIGVMP